MTGWGEGDGDDDAVGEPGSVGGGDGPTPLVRSRRRWPLVTAALLLGLGLGVGTIIALDGGSGEDVADFCRVLGGPPQEAVGYIVFLEADASDREVEDVGDHIAAMGVQDLTFVSQEEAYDEAMELFEGRPETQEIIQIEDLPPSWRFRHRGASLRPGLDRFAVIREIESSDEGLSARAVDLLGDLAAGQEMARLRVFDGATATALRQTAPGAVDDAAGTVTAWLAEIAAPEDGTGDPPAPVRSAARELVGAADQQCGLRPYPPG